MKVYLGKICCWLILFHFIAFHAYGQQKKSLELAIPESANKDHAACIDIHFMQGYNYVAGSNESMHAHIDPGMNCDADSQGTSSGRLADSSPSKDSSGKDVILKYGVSVYPNPASENINIIIAALVNGQSAALYLFDNEGKNIITKRQSEGEDNIELKGLSSGIYLLRIVVNDEQVFYRIIKQ